MQAGGHRFDPGTLHFKEAVKVAFNGSRRTIISFVPDESSAEEGLCYRLYRDVYAELAKRPPADVESLMPVRRDHWIYKEGAGWHRRFARPRSRLSARRRLRSPAQPRRLATWQRASN